MAEDKLFVGKCVGKRFLWTDRAPEGCLEARMVCMGHNTARKRMNTDSWIVQGCVEMGVE